MSVPYTHSREQAQRWRWGYENKHLRAFIPRGPYVHSWPAAHSAGSSAGAPCPCPEAAAPDPPLPYASPSHSPLLLAAFARSGGRRASPAPAAVLTISPLPLAFGGDGPPGTAESNPSPNVAALAEEGAPCRRENDDLEADRLAVLAAAAAEEEREEGEGSPWVRSWRAGSQKLSTPDA